MKTYFMPCLKHGLKRVAYRGQRALLRPVCRRSFSTPAAKVPDLEKFTPDKIRNFCIIAHIDHGKSTLSDRLLEITGLISKEDKVEQFLDNLQVEKERGITVKAQSASIIYKRGESEEYLLNLIDTPGHVDFSYEVSRSLPVCQGALLLVDANNGVQAQTVAHFNQALLADVNIIPVINKIDLKNARPDDVVSQLNKLFSFSADEILKISAKTGINVDKVLEAVTDRIPPPPSKRDAPFEALLFDSYYDKWSGVVMLVLVVHGSLKPGDTIASVTTKRTYEIKKTGILHPTLVDADCLYAGQVGCISANIRNTEDAIVGDTLVGKNSPKLEAAMEAPVTVIPKAKPMIFAGIYPCDQSQTVNLKTALEKIILTDASVTHTPDVSAALGAGWRLGFLGLLHMEVFCQRLDQEFDAPTVITTPSVPYKGNHVYTFESQLTWFLAVKIKGEKNIKEFGGEIVTVTNPLKMPDVNIISNYYEPMVIGTIITPDQYLAAVNKLCMERRGESKESVYIDQKRIMLQFHFPLSEVIVDFYDNLKSVTSGYASFDYEEAEYREADLVRIDILLNGKMVEELSALLCAQRARTIARELCVKLKETIPRQQFLIAIQAVKGGKVIAREDIKAYRKDVTAKLYGGDVTRKNKLLANQKEGKRRMRMLGNIEVPRDVFIKILRKST